MNCPKCGGMEVRRSRRRSLRDKFLSLWGVLPWRCLTCKHRFYGGTVKLRDLFYAYCPVCGNRDLVEAPSWRFHGPWAGAARRLGMRGVRCDLCRENFFAVRPARRLPEAKSQAVK